MATNNRGVDYADLWAMYKNQDEYNDEWAKNHKAQILHLMQLEKIGNLSYKVQLEVLDNAPMDIVKQYAHLLHDKTKKALGIEEPKKKSLKKTWAYGAFL